MSYRSSLTVMIVDDCPQDRLIYQRILQRDSLYSYRILEFETATAAAKSYQQEPPDVILLDFFLPDADGLEFLSQFRERVSDTQAVVIMLTGQGDESIAVQAMKSGAQDYLIKNKLTAEVLQRTIHHAVQRMYLNRKLEQSREQQQLIADIALRIRQLLQLEEILRHIATEVRQFLKVDRVLVYQFHPDMSGTIVAESVLPGWTEALGKQIQDTYFQQEGGLNYCQGRKQAVDDVYQAGLTDCHLQLLESFEVKANLVMPILVAGQLWGLIVLHQCSAPRHWQEVELELLEQLAVQIAIAIQQATVYEQVQTELAERRQREATLELFFKYAPAGIAMLDHNLRYIMVSQWWLDDCRLESADMLIGRSHYEVCPDISERHRLIHQRCLNGAIERCEEDCFVWPDGSKQWNRWEVRPWYKANQEIGGLLIFSENITACKQAEQERQQAQRLRIELQLLENILEVILAGYWDWHISNHQMYLSKTFKRMLGYEDHELPNAPETWQRLIFAEDLLRVWQSFDQHVKSCGQIPHYNEVRYRHKNGSTIWVICAGQVIEWNQDGKPLRMIGCHINITQRKQIEQALKISEARYRAIIEDQTELIARFSPNGTLLFVNEAYCRYFGLQQESIINKSYEPVIFSEDQEMVLQQVQSLSTENPTVTIENRVIVNGEVRWTQWINRMLFDKQGQFVEIQAVGRDISKLKQAEALLRQINKQLENANAELARATRLKDEFLANMSHELRTPLNTIMGMSEGLQLGVFGLINERQSQAIATVEKSANHLLELINDILDLSKIEAGKLELELSDVPIKSFCDSCLAFLEQMALQKDISLSTDICANIYSARIDERRLRQVLINLLSNAVKFTPDGGLVKLEVFLEEAEAPFLCFCVTDTGIGIASDKISKLFQPFVQLDTSLHRQYPGTGLGLALVKQLVTLHGGTVSVNSQVGQGSCFTVRIPYHTKDELATTLLMSPGSSQCHPLPQLQKSPLILLAEDNQPNIDTLSSYLISRGYQVTLATNGKQAVDLTIAQQPDLILMDVQMPKMDGLEAIQVIRSKQQLRHIPIIALTVLATAGNREKYLTTGANECWTKPIKLRQLNLTIQQLLAKRGWHPTY